MEADSKRSHGEEMQIINFPQNCCPINLHTLIRLEREKFCLKKKKERKENNPFIMFC